MKTRSITKAAPIVIARKTVMPSPKLQDLKMEQKVSCWRDEVQSPTKFQSPVCKVEGYYSSDSSSSPSKGAFY